MIRIATYNYNKFGSFEVTDTNGQLVWIVFEEMRKPYEGALHEEYIPIEIIPGN